MGPIVGGPDDVFRVKTRRSASLNEGPGSTSGELSPLGRRVEGDGTRPGGRGILFYMATAGVLPILSRHRPGNRKKTMWHAHEYYAWPVACMHEPRTVSIHCP